MNHPIKKANLETCITLKFYTHTRVYKILINIFYDYYIFYIDNMVLKMKYEYFFKYIIYVYIKSIH